MAVRALGHSWISSRNTSVFPSTNGPKPTDFLRDSGKTLESVEVLGSRWRLLGSTFTLSGSLRELEIKELANQKKG